MKDKLVKDIMVPVEEYPCIPYSMTIGDAVIEMTVQILRKKRLSLPRVAMVFDEDFNDLIGLLRRRDIMRGLLPDFMISGGFQHQRKLFNVGVDPNLAELSFERVIAGMRARSRRLVKEFTRPITATIRHDDHIMKAIAEMVDLNTSLIPVVDGESVVGVVRSVDVLGEIALII